MSNEDSNDEFLQEENNQDKIIHGDASKASLKISSEKSRTPFCTRCRNHSLIIPLKNHKRWCKYRDCICYKCILTYERQKLTAQQTALKRAHDQDKKRQEDKKNKEKKIRLEEERPDPVPFYGSEEIKQKYDALKFLLEDSMAKIYYSDIAGLATPLMINVFKIILEYTKNSNKEKGLMDTAARIYNVIEQSKKMMDGYDHTRYYLPPPNFLRTPTYEQVYRIGTQNSINFCPFTWSSLATNALPFPESSSTPLYPESSTTPLCRESSSTPLNIDNSSTSKSPESLTYHDRVLTITEVNRQGQRVESKKSRIAVAKQLPRLADAMVDYHHQVPDLVPNCNML